PVDAKSSWDAHATLTPEDMSRVLYDWQLTRVRLYDVHIERLQAVGVGRDPVTKPVLESRVRVSVSAKGLLARLSLTVVFPNEEAPEYRMQLSLDGFWTPKDPSVSPPTEDKTHGGRLAATMLTLLWPYARESAHDLMRRMEVPIHPLPTIDKLEIHTVAQERAESDAATDSGVVES
ncbi:MAG TPA: hypothetical protein VMY98_02025, partial [Anaerolineae bacterium]|nr:hypothetical protein [Anaerolineae bacterium]